MEIDVNFFRQEIVINALFLCTTLSMFSGRPNMVGLSMSGILAMKLVNYFWFFGIVNPSAT